MSKNLVIKLLNQAQRYETKNHLLKLGDKVKLQSGTGIQDQNGIELPNQGYSRSLKPDQLIRSLPMFHPGSDVNVVGLVLGFGLF